jgi:hypothetical protein
MYEIHVLVTFAKRDMDPTGLLKHVSEASNKYRSAK